MNAQRLTRDHLLAALGLAASAAYGLAALAALLLRIGGGY